MSSPVPAHDAVRQLRVLGLAYLGAAVTLFVVLLVLAGGWDPADDDLVRLGSWLAAVTGIAGLGAAIWWRNHVGRGPLTLRRLRSSWFVVVAVAEIGMILGLVFAMLSRSLAPFVVGAGIFAVALFIVTSAIGDVQVESDTPSS